MSDTSFGPRSRARAMAMQAIYLLDGPTEPEDANAEIGTVVMGGDETDGNVREQARRWARRAWDEKQRLDRLISEAADNWAITRIAPVDRAILRVAASELLAESDTPTAVVIDEAIELAKRFSTAEAGGFVNGVLDRIAKREDLDAWREGRELPAELA